MAQTLRLDRCVVGLGGGSRTEVSRAIRRGRVSVDGQTVRNPSARVAADAVVSLDGEILVAAPRAVVWHKPVGVITTRDDPWGRSDLSGEVPELVALGLHPVGRLDRDTSGLLLWSSDGALTQHLLHPRRGIPRRYVATVEADPPEGFAAHLAEGVGTAEGVHQAEDVEVDGRTVTLTVREGRHRMVRRMLHNAGASCATLHRVEYGTVVLDDLPVGGWRALTDEEIAALGG